jgi:signal transduction histidine kinase
VLDWAGAAGHARLIGRRLEDLGGGEPWATLASIGEDVRTGSPAVTREVRDALARRTWLVTGTSLGSQGEEAGWVILDFQDVTATSELKERLRQSETMAAVGAIVAGVAHEVRNPLFSISATVDAFESRYNREEYGPYLELLRSEIARLRGLMQDLLDLGRPPALEPGACVVLEVLSEAVRASTVLAQKRGVEVNIREENGPLEVFADRRRLVQVFQNLIDNAIHFSPPSGRVEVVAKGLGLGSERYVEVMVRDTGSGIRPEDLPRLFEPFFTRRQGGTGLGLPIVRRIVFDHEGEISAANHPDGGALLTVRLPVGN